MYLLAKLSHHRGIIAIVAAFAMVALMVPSMSQALQPGEFNPEDPLGLEPIDNDADGIALGKQDLRTTASKIINVSLSLLGIVAVVVVLIGGFKWMTSGGSEDKVGEARKLIFSGIVGLAIILSAWVITRFVINALGSATNTAGFDPA